MFSFLYFQMEQVQNLWNCWNSMRSLFFLLISISENNTFAPNRFHSMRFILKALCFSRKLKNLNQQLLDENKKLITNTISVNKRLLSEMHSKGTIYWRFNLHMDYSPLILFSYVNQDVHHNQKTASSESRMVPHKRREELFADEIQSLRKEIYSLSSFQNGTWFHVFLNFYSSEF